METKKEMVKEEAPSTAAKRKILCSRIKVLFMKNRRSRKIVKFRRRKREKRNKTWHVSRGKRIVELSKQRKRKNDQELKKRSKVPKPTKGEDDTKLTAPCTTKRQNFKELD